MFGATDGDSSRLPVSLECTNNIKAMLPERC